MPTPSPAPLEKQPAEVSLIWDLWEIPPNARNGAVSVGNFDGVHVGHRSLIDRLRRVAEQIDGPSVAVTFDPHPSAILRPGSEPQRLTDIPRRAELLFQLGVDHVIVANTSEQLLSLSAESFFESVLLHSLHAKAIVEGPNFYFGRGRGGTPELLSRWSHDAGIVCEIIHPHCQREAMVSSSMLRQLIQEGNIESANTMLTAPYRISGRVIHGDGRGHRLGFPTANLAEVATVVPSHGVYATRAWINGKSFASATHIGPNPTFESNDRAKIEVHVVDYSGDLYESKLTVDFIGRIRSIVRFDTIDALIAQLREDIQASVKIVSYAVPHASRPPSQE